MWSKCHEMASYCQVIAKLMPRYPQLITKLLSRYSQVISKSFPNYSQFFLRFPSFKQVIRRWFLSKIKIVFIFLGRSINMQLHAVCPSFFRSWTISVHKICQSPSPIYQNSLLRLLLPTFGLVITVNLRDKQTWGLAIEST